MIPERKILSDLPVAWNSEPPTASSQSIGDAWVRSATQPALSVPSAIARKSAITCSTPATPIFPALSRASSGHIWLIDTQLFCEGHKEKILEAFGVDRFPIRRLSESEPVFHGVHGGGRVSRVISKKK